MGAGNVVPAGALDKHIAMLGTTGSGKSSVARTIAEDLPARGARVCAIDPADTWWGLRLMADGAAPSGHRIVIFAGQHADLLPIQAADGPAIAGTIGTSPAIPAIIDTGQMTVSERTRFFTGFAETPVRTNQGELTVIRRSIAGGQAVLSFPALIIDRPADWLPIGTASVKSGGTQGGGVGRQRLMLV